METTELSKGTRVEVVKGLWKGFIGRIGDIHDESSVVSIVNEAGERAFAFKPDITPL